MPPRSNVITILPPYIRQEVERRLFENGFRDYEGLAQWVRGQGYEISDDSLWRYGRALQQQFMATQLTVRQACALAERSADLEGSMAQALITVAQQKALATLLEMQQVRPADLNAIANLTRAAIAQQRQTAELKARGEEHGGQGARGQVAHGSLPADSNRASFQQPQTTALTATVTPKRQAGLPAAPDPGGERRLPADPQTQKMSILSEAKDGVAQASLPAHLIWRGGDDERSISSLVRELNSAPAAGVQPPSHRCSPRIAADPRGSRLIATPPQPISDSPSHVGSVVGLEKPRKSESPNFTLADSVKHFLRRVVSGNEGTHSRARQTVTPIASPWQLPSAPLFCH